MLATYALSSASSPSLACARLHACRGRGRHGFTLIELLVVISIIALLIGILLPALGLARDAARATQSLSNLKQVGLGIANYNAERRGYFPMHSSAISEPTVGGYKTKPRWVDYLYTYMQTPKVYLSPLLDAREQTDFNKVFWHQISNENPEQTARNGAADASMLRASPLSDPPAMHGGYGYNFQYLGNARQFAGVPTYHANIDADIYVPSNTVAAGDVTGSRKGSASTAPGAGGSAVYAMDPPLGGLSYGSNGSRKSSPFGGAGNAYYEGGNDENTGSYDPNFEYAYRSAPAPRNGDSANIVFVDGHAAALKLDKIDDFNQDGTADNGYWNGRGDPSLR